MSKFKLLLLALSWAFVASADERMLVLHLDFNTIQMKKETVSDCLRTAAKAGYNAVLWEIENKVRWACCPECVHPEAFTKDEFRALLAEAKRLGLRPIPLMQTFGHAEYVLMTGKHPDWIEDPSFPACYCVSNPEVVAFQKRLLHEYLELFGADVRDFHLGGDEALVFGTCPKCRQKPSFDFYAEHLKNIAGELESRRIRPGIWADRVIVLTNRADVVKIPRHYTMWNWNYGFGADDRKPGREAKGAFLSELGYDVIFGCASQSVKDSVFLPQYGRHGDNIVASADLVRRKNLRGLCVTSWSVHLYPKSLQYPLWELAAKRLLNPADDPQADFASVVKMRYGALDPQVLRTLSFWHNGLIGFDSRTWKGYMKPALPAEPGRLAEVLSGVDRWGAEARRQLRERNEKRFREIGAARAEIVRTARPGADADRLVRASELAQEYLKAVDAALDGRPVTPPLERTAAFYSEEQPRVSATNAAAIAWSVLMQSGDHPSTALSGRRK